MIIDFVLKIINKPRRGVIALFLLSSFLIFSCGTPSQQNSQTEIVNIFYSPSTEFLMNEVYTCANDLSIVLNVSAQSHEVYFQIGETDPLFSSFVYQIGEEEIVIAVNRQSEIESLNIEGAQDLFAGEKAQVWVYPSESDMQRSFDQVVMQGRSVSSFAKIASSSQIMVEALSSDSNAVGFIPKSEMNESLQEIYSLGIFPVLAVMDAEPQGALKNLLGCLQRN